MKWSIVTDSSCDLVPDESMPAHIRIAEVPFTITIGGKDYVDTSDLDVAAMVDAMEASPEASHSACPSPGDWYELFVQAENTIAVTISANLSGSYNSAMTARQMVLEKYPEKNIFVLNSRSAGSVLAMFVEKAVELIEQGLEFEAVVGGLEEMAKHRHTVFALASFSNLVKNGRVSKLSGFIAGKLGIWGIGVASDEGTIVVKSKTRGKQRIIATFLEDMKENLFNGGYVIISHCQNLEMATRLKEGIQGLWRTAKIKILETGGLCSYYAERHGMIVAY